MMRKLKLSFGLAGLLWGCGDDAALHDVQRELTRAKSEIYGFHSELRTTRRRERTPTISPSNDPHYNIVDFGDDEVWIVPGCVKDVNAYIEDFNRMSIDHSGSTYEDPTTFHYNPYARVKRIEEDAKRVEGILKARYCNVLTDNRKRQ